MLARASKSGWAFEWSTDGRAAGGMSGEKLTAAIEETFDVISMAGTADDAALGQMWTPILLRGPKVV